MADYDFIVVGGGASGSVLASRLAHSPSRPSVLLLEAGGDNADPSYLVPADRFLLAFTQPNLNWGYQTEPQTHLQGQRINYARGKGLGGSTAINFFAWIIGADEDFNHWAKLVDDEEYDWSHVKKTFKLIESYHVDVPDSQCSYIDPKSEDHGVDGPVHISYGDIHRKNVSDVFTAANQCGLGTNKDINSGNPIGLGMGAATAHEGRRVTASGAYLSNVPPNLNITLNSTVAKVLLSADGKTAQGVVTIDGRQFFARHEIVISGGALNSPQILLLSGIGPAEELAQLQIPVLADHPQVGKNLQDHCASPLTVLQKPGTSQWACFTEEETPEASSMSQLFMPSPMGWFKGDAVYKSSEFKALPEQTQQYLMKPTVPIFEICTHAAIFPPGYGEPPPVDSYLTALALFMNPMSTGSVKLNSSDPRDAPKIDPNLLSHEFDRRVAIESLRKTMEFLEAPVLKRGTIGKIGWPKSDSDEDIWNHIISTVFTSWHMCGTVRMGTNKESAVVDSSFRVFSIDNLRVVDLSVCPLIPNNHTQSTAYLLGEIAARKIILEYGLGDASQ